MIDKVDFRERPWVQVDNRTENLLHLTETSLITKWYRNLSSGKAKELVIDPMVKKDESTNWAEIHAMFDPAVEAIHGIHHTQAIEKGYSSLWGYMDHRPRIRFRRVLVSHCRLRYCGGLDERFIA